MAYNIVQQKTAWGLRLLIIGFAFLIVSFFMVSQITDIKIKGRIENPLVCSKQVRAEKCYPLFHGTIKEQNAMLKRLNEAIGDAVKNFSVDVSVYCLLMIAACIMILFGVFKVKEAVLTAGNWRKFFKELGYKFFLVSSHFLNKDGK